MLSAWAPVIQLLENITPPKMIVFTPQHNAQCVYCRVLTGRHYIRVFFNNMENQYRLAIISVLNKKKASFIEVTVLNVLISEIACMLVPFGCLC